MIEKIVSGGQTGVDRAALDATMEVHFSHGGWCPKGRKAEDGVIADHYVLTETATDDYSERTKCNVRDSDGTLIIVKDDPMGGTLLTIEEAVALKKPYLVVKLTKDSKPDEISDWVRSNDIKVLNVAGPRESQTPGIYAMAKELLKQLIAKELALTSRPSCSC